MRCSLSFAYAVNNPTLYVQPSGHGATLTTLLPQTTECNAVVTENHPARRGVSRTSWPATVAPSDRLDVTHVLRK